ncbi:Ninja family [Quillaja saponaria]|uniref:Ninja-family protein n=1 Tax=Quillaja saponaria TaxID=32244 RepID=A0AAD7LE54_QUISA|nr:Ninja family [Quillaja saponaria]
MAEANQKHNVAGTNLCMQGNQNRPRLLQNLFPLKPNSTQLFTNSEPLDLNLKLSLGLPRSSSIAVETTSRAVAVVNEPQQDPSPFSLERSYSMPAEADKGLISMRELLTMKRVNAGRKLLLAREKRTASNAAAKALALSAAANTPASPAAIAAANAAAGREKSWVVADSERGMQLSSSEMVAWAAASASKSSALARAIEKIKKSQGIVTGNSTHEGNSSSSRTQPKQDMDSMLITGITAANQKSPRSAEVCLENPAKKSKGSNTCTIQDDVMDIMRKMPSVSTTGGIPNGRRIEGFLYKYVKGHVSIVCVCHGNFLTPEEFVQHAGGKDVTNPMRHITVCSTVF